MRCDRAAYWFLVALCLAVPVTAAAQDSASVLHARGAALPPTLDGVLDDAVWSAEPLPLGPWISYQPLHGERAPETTQVWVAYDSAAIYFAFRCFDGEPAGIRATVSRRDADTLLTDDYVAVSLDSSGAGQVAYQMAANAAGVQADALIAGVNPEDFAADWVWQSAGRVDDTGYTVEMRVPLESIRFRGGSNVQMRMLFMRRSSRLSVSWSSPEMPPGKGMFESHTTLLFPELHQPRVLEAIPTLTASHNQTRLPGRAWAQPSVRGDLGLSLKYGLTSTIAFDGTVNPDFSQVESDAFEVEINQRFPVFFSEKRPFFMEGLGLLNIAGTGGNATMRTAVHTRRIIEPIAGIKLTGSSGRHTFALLSTADESVAGDSPRFFTIGRGVRNFGEGQYAGLLATSAEHANEHNRVIGGDFALRHGDNVRWNGSLLFTDSQSLRGRAGSGIGSQLSYSYNTKRLRVAGQAEHYGRNFDMATAFINRVGISRVWQHYEVQFYPRYAWLQRVAPFVFLSGGNDRHQGGTEHYIQPAVVVNFTRQGFIFIGVGRGREPFANEQFRTGSTTVTGSAQLTRWLNFGASFVDGPAVFYDPVDPFQGSRRLVSGRALFQPNAKLAHTLSYTFVNFERESTKETVFDAHIVNIRNVYQFTREFLIRAIAQLDTSRRRMLTDFLASYELMPGTVIYAGYGSLLGREETESYRPTARAFFFKASYLARF